MNKTISIVWSIDDVQSLDSRLTDDEAYQVLKMAESNHDATIGMNWDVLQYHIDEFKKERKMASFLPL
jgi:hypothetical protein